MPTFSQALLSERGDAKGGHEAYRRKYVLGTSGIEVELTCPLKKEIDLLVRILEKESNRGTSKAARTRLCRTMRIRTYLTAIYFEDGSSVHFRRVWEKWKELFHSPTLIEKILSVFRKPSDPLEQLKRHLEHSLDFASEGLYNVLVDLSDQFKRHLEAEAGKLSGSSSEAPDELVDFVQEQIAAGRVSPGDR